MIEWLPNDVNKNTAQESTYKKKKISETNAILELPEVIYFP